MRVFTEYQMLRRNAIMFFVMSSGVMLKVVVMESARIIQFIQEIAAQYAAYLVLHTTGVYCNQMICERLAGNNLNHTKGIVRK